MNLNPLSRLNPTSKSALMFVGVLLSSVALCWWGHITGAEWISLWTFALPVFLGAEAYRATKKEPGAPPQE